MRNFYDKPKPPFYDKLFPKQARQIQADPSLDVSPCKCCDCKEVLCKNCMQGHVISPTVGCCHTKNNGLIFEYERPGFAGGGAECCANNEPCCPPPDPNACPGGWIDPGDIVIQPPPGGIGPGQDCRRPDSCIGLPDCNSVPRYLKKCCSTGKLSAGNVRFYYNYIGQYYRIDFECTGKYSKYPYNGLPRLCSYCDPSSMEQGLGDPPAYGQGDETCLDYLGPAPPANPVDARRDDGFPADPMAGEEYPCSSHLGINIFKRCQCMGEGDLEDPYRTIYANTFNAKRLSKYKRRQMEANPQYRWLLDIMCYDKGNVFSAPYHEYVLNDTAILGDSDLVDASANVVFNANGDLDGGTLYNHLIGVVHCEHWYEIARCNNLNPEHPDGNVLGSWIKDENGNSVGANTSYIAPGYWIYACSGIPIFDFEIQRARFTYDEFGVPFINDDDYKHIIQQFAQRRTPRQAVMDKLAKAGLFDLGDWRQEALNEIQMLRGLSSTSRFYGQLDGSSGDVGACCFFPQGDLNHYCEFMSGNTCGLCGGVYFRNKECKSDVCVNCSGFKQANVIDIVAITGGYQGGPGPAPGIVTRNTYSKYLGPVRKRFFEDWIPNNPQAGVGIGYRGITRPAFLDPRKARKNETRDLLNPPAFAEGEERNYFYNPDPTLVNLQLPDDLLPMPWGDFTDKRFWELGFTLPEWIPGEPRSKERLEFEEWTKTQWLYMHAKPGGWDYVCPGWMGYDDAGNPIIEDPRIPILPRKYTPFCAGRVGCCLDGVKGWPQRTYQLNGGGCPDIQCGWIDQDGNQQNAPTVGCNRETACVGLNCDEGDWCTSHPEQGGGPARCNGVVYSSDCNGIRFNYYRHRQVNGDGINSEDYTTCNGSVSSWLYRVNLDAGNYGSFCPHTCRPKSNVQSIITELPPIEKGKLAPASSNEQRLQGDFRGSICPGLYTLSVPIHVINPNGDARPPFYGPGFGSYSHCCSGKRGTGIVNDPDIPRDSTHDAANRSVCPLFPHPRCRGPACPFYDGRFVGEYIDWNPAVCCWKCGLSNGTPVALEYQGIRDAMECWDLQPPEILEYDDYGYTGRGIIHFDQIGSESGCGAAWAGECACGGLPPYEPPEMSGMFCAPDPPPNGEDDPNQGGY